MKSIGLFRISNFTKISDVESNIIKICEKKQINVFAYNAEKCHKIKEQIDFLITLGGDGTVLRAFCCLEKKETPILAVSLGTLGYLTELDVFDIESAIEKVYQSAYQLDKRSLLEVKLFRKKKQVLESLALNEAVVRSPHAKVVELEVAVNNNFATLYKADGLIVSTPTGSTAYNLSAGGPLISPTLNSMVISPISPHTLSVRSVVLPGNDQISIKNLSSEAILSVDGAVEQKLELDDKVVISESVQIANFIRLSEIDFFATLRSKLMWSGKTKS